MWDALEIVCGTPKTRSESSDFAKTVAELRVVIPTDADVAAITAAMGARRTRWTLRYPGAEFTHRVLRKHWTDLGRARTDEVMGAVRPDDALLEDDGTGRRTF